MEKLIYPKQISEEISKLTGISPHPDYHVLTWFDSKQEMDGFLKDVGPIAFDEIDGYKLTEIEIVSLGIWALYFKKI